MTFFFAENVTFMR